MLLNLIELPFFDPIIEDEVHVLSQCPLYEDLRENLSDSTRITLLTDLPRALALNDELMTREIGKFLIKVNERRFLSSRIA